MRLPALALAAAFPCGGVLGLAENRSETLRSELLIGHHGGKNSTTQEFLRAVEPRIGIISVGEVPNCWSDCRRRAHICCAPIAMAPCTF